MTTHRNANGASYRGTCIICCGWLLFFSGVTCGDQIVLLVDAVPEHGLVVKHVDLASVAAICRIQNVDPQQVRATDRDGRDVSLQFIPDPDFDLQKNATGLIVARLTPDRVNYLKLDFARKPGQRSAGFESIETRFYSLVHDPQKGGLPAGITFRKTGKVFDNFRWQDRLHHSELGGFTLQNDRTASVECVSAGPLCTVVRVRAKYVSADGKSPPSSPEATYQWAYLNDLPLVFVVAQVRQANEFQWNELHFLELNFPGEDFMKWAGGEPFAEGPFEATGRSHHAAGWGALLDGANAIAMFDCGQLIFHDGRGGYGTYLHAHGDSAWKPWARKEAQFSCCMWIGSDNNAVAEIRRLAGQSPAQANVVVTTVEVRSAIESAGRERQSQWFSAMAAQLEASGRFQQSIDVAGGRLPPNWTMAKAGDLNLLLEKDKGGIRMLSLFDTAAGQELLSARTLPLFSITLRDSRTKQLSTLYADSGWREVDISSSDANGQYTLSFAEPVDDSLDSVSVELSLQTDRAKSGVDWDMKVVNDSSRWGLWHVVFPQISIRSLGEGAKAFLPHTAGIEVSDIWKTSQKRGGTYPSGWTCMQYMAAYDKSGQTGLYVGVHDPFGSTKDILAEGTAGENAVAFRFEHPVPDMGKPGKGFDLPGEAKWQLLRGDWFDAAKVYRSWVVQEAKWWPRLGPDGRSDTPKWMRQLPAWALTGGPPAGCVPATAALAKELGLPVGFHWYNWHQIPFDNDYPHYFPAKDGFAEGVAELKKAGVYVMPYINGRLWDTHDHGAEDRQFTSVGLPAATKDEHGSPYTESYGSKETDGNNVTLAAMCPSTSLWQNKVRSIVLRLFNECGVSGVYIDQIAAAQPRLCFDASHGHAMGGGHWWTEGYWKMLDAIRAARPADCMLTTECNAEPYIRWFDGYLTWHWQEQDMVPAFPAVYGGSIQMFGRAYRGGPSQDLANRMKAGQQLVFGEQIGWFGPEIIKRADSGPFLKDCIELRWRLQEYFYAGRMARPPKLIGDIPRVTADWQWRSEWPITTDAIITGAWRIEGKRKTVLLFANVCDMTVAVHLKFNPAEYGLAGESFKAVPVLPSWHLEPLILKAAVPREIELPARSVLAWEVGPGQ